MLKLAPIFTDHLVLQQNSIVTIWGTAAPGTEIYTSLRRGEKVLTIGDCVAGEDGTFEVRMSVPAAQTGLTLTVLSEEDDITLHDVALGEVWLAGGQSNMEYELKDATGGKEFLGNGAAPNVRFFHVPRLAYFSESYDAEWDAATWQEFGPEVSGSWSAVGFWYALELANRLDVTVGVIGCNWGGTVAFNWISKELLLEFATTREYVQEYEEGGEYTKPFEEQLSDWKAYEERSAKWEERAAEVYAKDPMTPWDQIQEIIGMCEYPGPVNECSFRRPGGLYETMIKKIAPYRLAGVLYYQGESDEVRPTRYGELLEVLSMQWREDFRDERLPILLVQLPMHRYRHEEASDTWCTIRQKQREFADSDQCVGLAVCIDLGEFHQIHPVEKREVAHRLYLQAMHVAYRKNLSIEVNGPRPRRAFVSGEKVFVDVSDYEDAPTPGSLSVADNDEEIRHYLDCLAFHQNEAKACHLPEDHQYEAVAASRGFEVLGQDGDWYPADRVVLGAKSPACQTPAMISVSSSAVPCPSGVRYLWKNYYPVFVFDDRALPLEPFSVIFPEGKEKKWSKYD